MNPFIPAFVMVEIGVFLAFTKIVLNARRNIKLLVWLGIMVMYWVVFLFDMAIKRFFGDFTI